MVEASGTTTYKYDGLQQLKKVTYPEGQVDDYVYDANGNRRFRNADEYTYDDADQLKTVFTPDSDNDGCTDAEEQRDAPHNAPGETGLYDRLSPANDGDFYDVPAPAITSMNPNPSKNKAVTLQDVSAVLFYSGTSAGNPGANPNGVTYGSDLNANGVPDGQEYDRTPSDLPNPPWGVKPHNNAVSGQDTSAALQQIGRSCIGLPNHETVTYLYDANGNLTNRGLETFFYDHENRLTSGAGATYTYNGDGLRAARNTTSYVWDVGAGLPSILSDSAGNKYAYGLGLISRTDSAANQEYHLSDGLGSTTALANGSGTVTDTYSYDVFGSLRSRTGTSGNEFKFAGEQTDASGLQYLRARYYEPRAGRFLSRDPLAARPGWGGHVYVYGGSNPVNLTDATGLEPEEPEPVPLPRPGSDDDWKYCEDEWLKCLDDLAPKWARIRRNDPNKYMRTEQPYNEVCWRFRERCENEILTGRKPFFDRQGAEYEMENLPAPGKLIDIDRLKDLLPDSLPDDLLPDIVLGVPSAPELQWPNTGSAGPRDSKEGGFACGP